MINKCSEEDDKLFKTVLKLIKWIGKHYQS